MQLAMIGLGRMGANMRDRLVAGGHEVLGYDQDRSRSDAENLVDLVARLARPRHVWVMVPAGAATRFTIEELATLLEADDLVIDGGNSKWSDDAEHARILAAPGVRYLDCGVSGGVWGREYGYGLMVGGDEVDVARMMPAFDTLRPEGPRDLGFSHAGGVGAGHYAKMVHNGIEYGLMQAYAEGYELLELLAGRVRRGGRGERVVPRHRDPFLAAGAAGGGAGGGSRAERPARGRGRFRRGAMDGGRGGGERGTGTCDLSRPVRALRLTPGRLPCHARGGCAARAVRRARGRAPHRPLRDATCMSRRSPSVTSAPTRRPT